MIEGFETKDGYAAVPYGKQLMVIFNGQQLKVCKTANSAQKFIQEHRCSPQSGTIFIN